MAYRPTEHYGIIGNAHSVARFRDLSGCSLSFYACGAAYPP